MEECASPTFPHASTDVLFIMKHSSLKTYKLLFFTEDGAANCAVLLLLLEMSSDSDSEGDSEPLSWPLRP